MGGGGGCGGVVLGLGAGGMWWGGWGGADNHKPDRACAILSEQSERIAVSRQANA